MCDHLTALDRYLKQIGMKETFRGQAWGNGTREWVYYDCVLNLDKISSRYQFPDFVKIHINDDVKSGMEAGFYCEQCQDGVMGIHPHFGKNKKVIE
jgi:hypothetical protein